MKLVCGVQLVICIVSFVLDGVGLISFSLYQSLAVWTQIFVMDPILFFSYTMILVILYRHYSHLITRELMRANS